MEFWCRMLHQGTGGPIRSLALAANTFTKAREYTADASMYITAHHGTVQRILEKARFHPKGTYSLKSWPESGPWRMGKPRNV